MRSESTSALGQPRLINPTLPLLVAGSFCVIGKPFRSENVRWAFYPSHRLTMKRLLTFKRMFKNMTAITTFSCWSLIHQLHSPIEKMQTPPEVTNMIYEPPKRAPGPATRCRRGFSDSGIIVRAQDAHQAFTDAVTLFGRDR